MAEIEWNSHKYISERVHQYQNWYDKKAVTAKARYLRMRTFSVVAGGLVPILINIPDDLTPFGFPVIKTGVTIISLLVVVSVSLESVLHYREQWKNYRSTEQLLGHEIIAYKSAIGSYRDESEEGAFKFFVERVEEAIRAENSATLNVMTMANEPPDDPHKRTAPQKI